MPIEFCDRSIKPNHLGGFSHGQEATTEERKQSESSAAKQKPKSETWPANAKPKESTTQKTWLLLSNNLREAIASRSFILQPTHRRDCPPILCILARRLSEHYLIEVRFARFLQSKLFAYFQSKE